MLRIRWDKLRVAVRMICPRCGRLDRTWYNRYHRAAGMVMVPTLCCCPTTSPSCDNQCIGTGSNDLVPLRVRFSGISYCTGCLCSIKDSFGNCSRSRQVTLISEGDLDFALRSISTGTTCGYQVSDYNNPVGTWQTHGWQMTVDDYDSSGDCTGGPNHHNLIYPSFNLDLYSSDYSASRIALFLVAESPFNPGQASGSSWVMFDTAAMVAGEYRLCDGPEVPNKYVSCTSGTNGAWAQNLGYGGSALVYIDPDSPANPLPTSLLLRGYDRLGTAPACAGLCNAVTPMPAAFNGVVGRINAGATGCDKAKYTARATLNGMAMDWQITPEHNYWRLTVTCTDPQGEMLWSGIKPCLKDGPAGYYQYAGGCETGISRMRAG